MVAAFDCHLLRILPAVVYKFIIDHLFCYGFQVTEVVFRAPMGKEFKKMLALPTVKFQQALQMSVLRLQTVSSSWGVLDSALVIRLGNSAMRHR